MDCFICLIMLEILYFYQCSSFICLSWTFEKNTLRLKCQTSHMQYKISFYDPYNQEQGHCAVPVPFPKCIIYNQHGRIAQNINSKETFLNISGNVGNKIDGQWSCHLGRNIESAVTNVKFINGFDKTSSVSIRLKGPVIFRTHEPMWLTCFSNVPLKIIHVEFYVNDKLYIRISTNKHSCHSSVHNRQCKLGECLCEEDGQTFHVKHEGFKNNGTIPIRCNVAFELQMDMSDFRLNYIIDIETPEIRHDKTLPFTVSDNISLSCFVSIKHANVQVSWDCFDLIPVLNASNSTLSKSLLALQVTQEMNNSFCRCDAIYGNITTSTSIKIRVSRAPVLRLQKAILCQQNQDIEIVCSASGWLSITDFGFWTHLYDGHFIRNLQGFQMGDTSTIVLNMCSYEDEGEYVCSAWAREQNISEWNNVSSNVIIQGSPLVTKMELLMKQVPLFAVKIYAVPSYINIYWFNGNKKIHNSTRYFQTVAEGLIKRNMHGMILTTKGYFASLAMNNVSNENFPTNLFVIVENEIGNVTEKFIYNTKDSSSHSSDNAKGILWTLTGIFILGMIVIGSTVFFKRLAKRGNDVRSVYYAAPHASVNVHEYDIPEQIQYNEEETIHNVDTSLQQQNKYGENENGIRDDSENGYEMPHDYIEVF